MSLFGRKTTTLTPKKSRFDINLDITNVSILLVMTLIFIQTFGLILSQPLGLNIKLGPIFILIPIGISSLISVAVFRKLSNNTQVTKKDVFIIFITAMLAVLVMMYLRSFVPEIFEQSIIQLQSMMSIGT